MTASQRAKHSEFKPVAAWVRDIQQQLEERACRVAAEHVARMAELPEGTCEYCYGTGKRDGEMCGRCNELELYAPGVPYEFHTATLGNYREDSGNKSALAKAKGFLVGTSDLYLTGGVGGGKTRLACSIANDAHSRGKHVRFFRVPQMLHQLQPGRDQDEVSELERQLFTTSILVLDDIGAERDQASDAATANLEKLCDRTERDALRGSAPAGARRSWPANDPYQQQDPSAAWRHAGRRPAREPDRWSRRRGATHHARSAYRQSTDTMKPNRDKHGMPRKPEWKRFVCPQCWNAKWAARRVLKIGSCAWCPRCRCPWEFVSSLVNPSAQVREVSRGH